MFRRFLICLGVPVVIIGSLSLYFASSIPRGSPEVKKFATSAWARREGYSFLMRAETEGGAVLLFRCLNREESLNRRYPNSPPLNSLPPMTVVYRYDPAGIALTEVGVPEWEAATGTIVDYGTGAAKPGSLIQFDVENHVLKFDGKILPTAGKTVLMASTSFDGKLMAVYSRTGEYKKPMLQFLLGGGGASGQSYHELFRTSDGTRVGEPLAIPYSHTGSVLQPWWSADGSYVIYHNAEFSQLYIIRLELGDEVQ